MIIYKNHARFLKFTSNFRIHGLSNTWIICELGEQFYNSWTFSEIQENFQFMKNLNHIIFWKFEALWEMCKHMIILWTFLAIEKERKYKSKNNNNKPGSPRIWAGQKHAWGAGVYLNLIIWRAGLGFGLGFKKPETQTSSPSWSKSRKYTLSQARASAKYRPEARKSSSNGVYQCC